MATPEETVPRNSHSQAAREEVDAQAEADAISEEALAPMAVPRQRAAVEDGTAEEMKREVAKMERQIDADRSEMEELIKRIQELEGKRGFESELFQFSRELINMRYARGLTPPSRAEMARLQEIRDLARHGMNQYSAAEGKLPAFISSFVNPKNGTVTVTDLIVHGDDE